MTNFDKLKDTKLGEWFHSVNGEEMTLTDMAHLMYLETNCDSCPCRDACGVPKISSFSDCKNTILRWLNADADVTLCDTGG